jgi:CheY-like chemotaxis protein
VVQTARSGPEGLAKARQFAPEVVLCDIGLPGMDGYSVARAFRADPGLRSVFLVALSGYAAAEDLAAAQEAGFDRHLAKPASMPAVEALVRSAGTTRGAAEPLGLLLTATGVRRSPRPTRGRRRAAA